MIRVTQMGKKQKKLTGHPAADALDWDEAMTLVDSLFEDGRYRDSLLVASGCMLGLRISDLLTLTWDDLSDKDTLALYEKKTGKKRLLRVNPKLSEHASKCKEMLDINDGTEYVFCGRTYGPHTAITRQRACQILAQCKKDYNIKSAKVFSTHSLRKTFGRRVWFMECEKGRGEQALLLLQDVFGHSSIQITKRYLGIRQDEILSVYDSIF